MLKNTAGQAIGAQMIAAADGSAFTGAVTVSVTGDAGAQATGSVGAGACVHEGNGFHTYAPAQAETNYAHVAFTFTGSGAIPATVQTYPIAGDAFTRLGAPVGASISADIAAVQADTDNMQTRLPAALVSGRIDASVGAMAANVMTAAAAAADLTTELQAGLATAAALTTAQADLDDIQTRLPAALVGGRMDASVGAMAANVLTAAATAADFTTEVTASVATSAALATVQADTDDIQTRLTTAQADLDDIQTRLPAALVSGRMDASVGAMAANVMTAAAAAADLTTELQSGLATSAALTTVAGNVTTIKASTDNLPVDPADQSLIVAATTAIYDRIGAPAGASIAADIAAISVGSGGLDAAGVRAAIGMAAANLDTQLAAVQADTDNMQTRLPAALVGGRMDASVGAMAANVMTAAAAAPDLTAELQTGLATAAALATVAGNVILVKASTDALPADPADQSVLLAAIAGITSSTPAEIAAAVAERELTEDYAGVGDQFTLQQALYMIWSLLAQRKVQGDVLTASALDNTAAMTFLLDDVVAPTEQVRQS